MLGPDSSPDQYARTEYETGERRYGDDILFGVRFHDQGGPGHPTTPWGRLTLHCRAVTTWHHARAAALGEASLAGCLRARRRGRTDAVLDAARLLWGDHQY
ncbi:hypothetical protein [Amycolatopsis sp. NPDC054798]